MTDGSPAPPSPRHARPLALRTLAIATIASAGILAWHLTKTEGRWTAAAHSEPATSTLETTDDAFIAGDVTPLATKVSGYIRAVPVTDFQAVKKGDLLAEIDPSDYNAALVQAQANVASAQANLDNLANRKESQQSLVRQAQAAVDAAVADLDRYTLEAKRQHDLLKSSDIGTTQRVEQADGNARRSTAQLALSKAQLDQQKTALASLAPAEVQFEAQLRAAKAVETLAQNNMTSTRILSPADGMVGQRQVRPGQFVGVGSPIITVVSLPNVWVIANFKETQMTNVRSGQTARIKVDAFPDLNVTGHVESWAPGTANIFASQSFDPNTASGNFTKVAQRVPVKIALDQNPAFGTLVRPGMSVEATINTGSGPVGTGSRPSTAASDPPTASAR
ncbi:HlyD family secretion protein [Hyphomicrobium sp.]|uniref:HlyD family secretion protein n=1 Tax=Hyphomicrobium sp. TaxID=82 RepID=UPI000F9D1A3D|nr:HlyD family secretion protein [Hyphomicrobium sp.]RUP08668.1 MAG: HlyD family secretion protein [Hyphomicrobium sp.]